MKKNNIIRTNWTRKILDFKWRFIEILALDMPRLEKHIVSLRKKITENELIMAEISQDDKVLLIGCGPCPTTALIVAEETQAKVVAIDKNIKAVEFASLYIKKNNLNDIIKIEYGDGIAYPIENFDVIFIAANVWPVDLVLSHIFHRVKDDVKVICRDFESYIKNIITDGHLSDFFYIDSSYDHEGYSGILVSDPKSLLLKKRNKE